MSETKEKLKRRKLRKVPIDGFDFYVVSQTFAESEHVDMLAATSGKPDGGDRSGEIVKYSLTVGLVEQDGSAVYDQEGLSKNPPEFDPDIALLPLDTAIILSQEIRNATTPPTIDSAKKN